MFSHVVSFSGGKDSTAMLLMMIEKNYPIDRVIYVDTTKEFPAMYKHIEKVQSMILPLKIETIKIDFDYWFEEYLVSKGKFKGNHGFGWPWFNMRWCTGLKQQAVSYLIAGENYNPRMRTFCKTKQKEVVIEYHGIAFDEKHRTAKAKNKNIRYPLVEWEITEKQALEYCYSKGFNWDGLYEKFYRVSCWCCPLSKIGGLRTLYNDFPELWGELEKMDKKSGVRYRADYTVAELAAKFAKENLHKPKELIK